MLFEHGFKLEKAYLGPVFLHDVTRALTDNFAFCLQKLCAILWRCDDVMTVESLTLLPFCL